MFKRKFKACRSGNDANASFGSGAGVSGIAASFGYGRQAQTKPSEKVSKALEHLCNASRDDYDQCFPQHGATWRRRSKRKKEYLEFVHVTCMNRIIILER